MTVSADDPSSKFTSSVKGKWLNITHTMNVSIFHAVPASEGALTTIALPIKIFRKLPVAPGTMSGDEQEEIAMMTGSGDWQPKVHHEQLFGFE